MAMGLEMLLICAGQMGSERQMGSDRFNRIGAGEGGQYERGLFTGGSLESPKSLNSLESLENGPIFLCFPQSGVL